MKYLTAILLLCFLVIPVASAQQADTAPTKVGIIGALDFEIELYLKEMKDYKTTDIGGLAFYSGILRNQPVVIVKSGVGKVYAASAATVLINEFDVNAVIFSGVAGGVDPSLKLGDIVVADKLIQHDLGTRTKDGFQWTENSFTPNELLSQLAVKSAQKTEFPLEDFQGVVVKPNIVRGTIVTGDQFIMSNDYVDWLFDKFGASCTEMEGAAVAAVCEEFHVPYTVVRCLSDRADDIADVDFDIFAPYAAKVCSLIVLEMLGDAAGIQIDMLSRAHGIGETSDTRLCRAV